MDPSSNPTTYTKAIAALKDIPAWLMFGVGVSLLVFVAFPFFSSLVPPAVRAWVAFAALLLLVLSVLRGISWTISLFIAKPKSPRRFHLTADALGSTWNLTAQPDGSTVSHIFAAFMVKNLTNGPLRLVSVTLKRPKIAGEIVQSQILVQGVATETVGSARNDYYVPGGGFATGFATLVLHGAPRQTTGDMKAVLTISDEEGNEQRLQHTLKWIGVAPSPSAAKGG